MRIKFKGTVLAIEVKTWRDSDKKSDPAEKGVTQLEGYMATVGAEHGWLMVFDQRAGAKDVSERVHVERKKATDGRALAVVWA